MPTKRQYSSTQRITGGAGFLGLHLIDRFLARGDEVICMDNQLGKEAIGLAGNVFKLMHLPLFADDPVQRCPDITCARDTLNWELRIQLRKGLQKTVTYFDTLLSEST